MIPKPSGGMRMLGVPAAVDRLICQAIAQVLTPVFDPHFHPCSFGFRPGRSQHHAVQQARQFIADDAAWCADFDLDSFFAIKRSSPDATRRCRSRPDPSVHSPGSALQAAVWVTTRLQSM
jgi:retron-type reverse transcriptase